MKKSISNETEFFLEIQQSLIDLSDKVQTYHAANPKTEFGFLFSIYNAHLSDGCGSVQGNLPSVVYGLHNLLRRLLYEKDDMTGFSSRAMLKMVLSENKDYESDGEHK